MIPQPSKKALKAAIKKMGRKPVNPIGTCFDSAIKTLFFDHSLPLDTKLCHAIITTNMPEQEPKKSGHAWLEFDHEGQRAALDTTWMLATTVDHYRSQLNIEYVVEYSKEEAYQNLVKTDQDNCWDEKIKAHSRHRA